MGETRVASADRTQWRSVVETFERHVRTRPDALAVEADGEARSYAELGSRVDRFAAWLSGQLRDTPPDTERLIGVCLARDVDLPAWLLAIFKIGAAYLPIDPATPAARLAGMIEDAAPVLIVASRRYARVFESCALPVLIAEDHADAPPAPISAVCPDTLAYVIFTSGSTGRPKGVEIEQGSLVALLTAMAVSPGFAAGERMLGITRISFDLSVPDMFLPFFVGGSLALVDSAVAADPERLAAAFATYRPQLAQATPSSWRALLEAGWKGDPELRILAGGETVTRALADALLPRCKEVWNIYGPTETTVWSTACRVRPGSDAIPIGRAMAGERVHVAGGDSTPLLAGEVGEIVIAGSGVARGYRNRPDLTAERFVVLPDGSRVYRTGDLGWFDDAGALHCLGRLDDQVKVRGFRIELGDIEAALALHPAVAWSAARLCTDPSGEPVLAGYIVARPGAAPTTRELKAFLTTRLADYMIPDRIVRLSVMPLTANGKIDRAALADPWAVATPAANRAIDDTVASRLSAIWRNLLGVCEITAQDDFFELGGYSLMTVRLTRRIEAEFGVRLALVEVMQHSTLDAMAARIERGDLAPSTHALLLNAGGTRPPLFWLDAGPLMRTVMRALSPDQPAFALNLDPADEDALVAGEVSITAIATRLRMRLASHQPSGPYYIGGWCRWGIVAFELARQLVDRGETVGLLAMIDAERPGSSPPLGLRHRLKTLLRMPVARLPDDPSFSQRVEFATRSYRADRYGGDVLLLRPEEGIGDGGWGAIVTGHLEIARIPGDHVAMVRGASAQVLAARIDHALQAAQRYPAEVRHAT